MSEPTAPAMTAEEAERHFRRALATRLRNGRVPDAPQWDDDAVRDFMAAVNAYAAGYARECIAALRPVTEGRAPGVAADAGPSVIAKMDGDGTVTVSHWTFPESGTGLELPARDWAVFVTAVKNGDYDEMTTVPATAPAASPPAPAAPKQPSRRAKAAAQS